jgi:5,5'-dehydrodivanillate O-demethylase
MRLLGEDFTLYRGESGEVHAVGFRCAHRGTQLSTGWVEGDTIRCFYHGWVYDGNGQCVEQPAEPEPFCNRIRIRGYPVQDYLGIIFIYMGEGEAPPLPRFRGAEGAALQVVETADWPFNFWNSLDNKQDYAHLPFVHQRGGARPDRAQDRASYHSWNGFDMTKLPTVSFEETDWGYTAHQRYPSGVSQIEHILMPNGYLHKSRPGNPHPEDPEKGWRDTIRWTVPIDDEHHRDFSLYLADATPEEARRYLERRAETVAKLDKIPQTELIDATLTGRMTTEELATYRVPQGKLQDGVARWGQGVIADRSIEHLGYTDRSLLLYRGLWLREMRALAEGRPMKEWRCPEDLLASWEIDADEQ